MLVKTLMIIGLILASMLLIGATVINVKEVDKEV
jgi:hypothetical protein